MAAKHEPVRTPASDGTIMVVRQIRIGSATVLMQGRRRRTPSTSTGSTVAASPLSGWPAGLAGSLGRSGRGAAKSSDPVGVAGRQKMLGVADSRVRQNKIDILGVELVPPLFTNTIHTTKQLMLYQM